ncbi:B12-binding domain-containing radical SAM protein [Candidatus Woesearchaeota archaeon]|nr:B12-binding domain-containing radical SAM protein [Candidatus Woesearchaeota archaeon]MBT7929736.1 B12-binding domain-containing radical SAM protein [Candidatus Peregrinibacteria bacterium]MBT3537862.1 B12-binding domain-containing radical SAM protein [Candidatus Woesearchaeota archaeon]MBT4697993.1 B12-binding domain-containing radical SAM protein [Candidatus Woesearchaeota archaeon]MBT4717666.1 B12-binding domain-containing radical SAM protein [Candidatus Woesearchaeota archaeon]
MKLQLVLPQEENYQPLNEGWWLPLGLTSIGTSVKASHPDVEVEILDGRHVPNDEISNRLDGDIVGFGPSVTSYVPALRMAKELKEKSPSSLVVFGGPYVTPMSGTILMRRSFIDGIVAMDGEESLEKIVAGGLSGEVPNLTFGGELISEDLQAHARERGLDIVRGPVRKTPRRMIRVKDAPFPDISLLPDLEKYWQDFWRTYPQHDGKGIIATAAQRGCTYRARKGGGCFFCSRVDNKYRVTDPKEYAEYVKLLEGKFGANIIEESSDDLVANKNWLRRFADAYEELGLTVEYRLFGRADKIDEETISLLKRIRAQSVFVGYESGDEDMLKVCNKSLSLDRARHSTKLLVNAGIEVVGAFILGFPGESERSVDNTVGFAQEMYEMGVGTISYAILTPLPPSPAWQFMRAQPLAVLQSRLRRGVTLGTDYGNSDVLDPVELQQDFVGAFCEVEYDYLTDRLRELSEISEVDTGDFVPSAN